MWKWSTTSDETDQRKENHMQQIDFATLGLKVKPNTRLYYNGHTYFLEYNNKLVAIETSFLYIQYGLEKNNLLEELK